MNTIAAVLIALSLSGCAAALPVALAIAPLVEPVIEGTVKGIVEGLNAPPPEAPAK